MSRGTALFTLLVLLGASAAQGQDGRLVDWVEDAAASDNTKIALGYPVPVPVDTPLPFDGFRGYAGLHARHQDLAATTPWVHARPVGETSEGRTIWLYQLGDSDLETVDGLPEHAMLTNGGIHAREWQSPEVATGIIELLALGPKDHVLLNYLRDNANVLVIPVLNIDGFLQTQRYPSRNWLGTDPSDPESSPRDGRMRRKNTRAVDHDLLTQADHTLGVDLNRNNRPYWATNVRRSSNEPNSLVYHGPSAFSEPETQALRQAAELGPPARLAMYTDLHSFSQVHFWVRNDNIRLARLTEALLNTFSNFHRSYPSGKYYAFSGANSVAVNSGIGTTDEFFTHTYQVPSWTLEIEPTNGAGYHAPLPGGGADYGGLGRNDHDGFILPDAEIQRVRTELAETFAVAYYRQSGPPSLAELKLVDARTAAVVFEAAWDVADASSRVLHLFQSQPLQLGRDYRAWISWDKPMRWRTDGAVANLPGQPLSTLALERRLTMRGDPLGAVLGEPLWLDQPGPAPEGYRHYPDDAMEFSLRLSDDGANQSLVGDIELATLHLEASDLTGNRADANPATVAHWKSGAWSGYEDSDGNDGNDRGGVDSTLEFSVTAENLGDPFVVEPGTSSVWFDPQRNGEGWVLEILSGDRAIMYWFTYDPDGRQDWYVAQGEILGNRILFPELLRVSGGEFGPGFDPQRVVRTAVGSVGFTWSSCDEGVMKWVIDRDGGARRSGRVNLKRLSRVMGVECGHASLAPELQAGRLSGSWFDPGRSGEGYVLEVLANHRALVYWFSFDGEGRRRWFFGMGSIDAGRLVFDDMVTTRGGKFGDAFDPQAVEVSHWGSLDLELGCEQGTARFQPSEAGFSAGILRLERLTRLAGIACDD